MSGLGAASVDALEIGNEPELYGSFGWYRTAGGHEVRGRPRSYDELDFENDFAAFSKAMPPVPLVGSEHRLADVGGSWEISCAASGGSRSPPSTHTRSSIASRLTT